MRKRLQYIGIFLNIKIKLVKMGGNQLERDIFFTQRSNIGGNELL